MVLFSNINVGQEVEVYYQGAVEKGLVKFKGGLANTQGDWVGIQLERPVGRHSGIYKGRQYFACANKHGIFVHPSRIRFCALRRTYFNHYRSVSPSYVDDTLFGSGDRKQEPTSVPSTYLKSSREGFSDLSASWSAGQKSKGLYSARPNPTSYSVDQTQTFALGHPIGKTFTPKKHQRTKSALETRYGRSISPLTKFYDDPQSPFISKPTVPKTHMPTYALKKQDQRGWLSTHRPKEWSI